MPATQVRECGLCWKQNHTSYLNNSASCFVWNEVVKYNPFKFFSLVAYILPVFDDIDNTSKKDNGYWELIISNPPNHANIKEVELSPHFACYQRCQSVKLKKNWRVVKKTEISYNFVQIGLQITTGKKTEFRFKNWKLASLLVTHSLFPVYHFCGG